MRIAVPIAPATETHCKTCQFSVGSAGWCGLWDKRTQDAGNIPGSKGGRESLRLPECIKATLPAEPWTEQRPTEAGYYWLSLSPTARDGNPQAFIVFVHKAATDYLTATSCRRDVVFVNVPVSSCHFDGARWMRIPGPTDPFAGGE